MLNFKDFIELYISEAKFGLAPGEDVRDVALNDPNWIKKIHAGRELTSANGHSKEDIAAHIGEMKAGNAHMKIAAILHPDANEHLSSEDIDSLKNHANKKVSSAAQKRWGTDSPDQPPVTKPAAKKSVPKPAAPAKVKAVKPKKAATKPSSGISVESGNPEDHGLPPSAKVSHVRKDGRYVATAITNMRPAFGELDRDTEVHQAFVGDHTKEDGLKHVGNFRSHQEALIAAAKANKK